MSGKYLGGFDYPPLTFSSRLARSFCRCQANIYFEDISRDVPVTDKHGLQINLRARHEVIVLGSNTSSISYFRP